MEWKKRFSRSHSNCISLTDYRKLTVRFTGPKKIDLLLVVTGHVSSTKYNWKPVLQQTTVGYLSKILVHSLINRVNDTVHSMKLPFEGFEKTYLVWYAPEVLTEARYACCQPLVYLL